MLCANLFVVLYFTIAVFFPVDGHRGVSYTLWVDNAELVSKTFPVPMKPSSFYEFMLTAAEIIPNKYNFTSTVHPKYGHYITSIGGIKEDIPNKHFWMIYELTEKPSIETPPSDALLSKVGVDFIKVKRGDFYLFWYRYVNHSSTEH